MKGKWLEYVLVSPAIVGCAVIYYWTGLQFVREVFLGKEAKPLYEGKSEEQGTN